MHIRIRGLGARIHLFSYSDFEHEVVSGEMDRVDYHRWDDWSARSFFRWHFRDPHDIGVLRHALASDVYGLPRLSDAAVLDIAARYLCRGTWRVACERMPAGVPLGQAAPGTRPPARAPASASASRQRPAPARAAPAVRTPTVSAAPEPEWTDDTDQAAFAEVLERAAVDAKPFCEVCAALRAQQAAAPA